MSGQLQAASRQTSVLLGARLVGHPGTAAPPPALFPGRARKVVWKISRLAQSPSLQWAAGPDAGLQLTLRVSKRLSVEIRTPEEVAVHFAIEAEIIPQHAVEPPPKISSPEITGVQQMPVVTHTWLASLLQSVCSIILKQHPPLVWVVESCVVS